MACENDFRRWLRDDPAKLIASLTDGSLQPADLTFAAEIAGALPAARAALVQLLSHDSSLVREGAIYGLSSFVGDHAIRTLLYQLSQRDPSPAVARAAADACEER